MSQRCFLCLFMIVGLFGQLAVAQDTKAEKKEAPKPAVKAPPMNVVPPTQADVPYGKHERQVIDFYQAKSDSPTPLVFYIHGGGWQGGSKTGFNVKPFLEAGISVAAINYRYVKNGIDDKVEPPVKAPLHDAARALQFVRSKAKEWNIDKVRIGATGGSAGGCSSLWLAFHDDLADPKSDDPIARESTRLFCAAVNGAQVTLDPIPLREWMPNYSYGAHAFNLKNLDEVNQQREKIADWIKEYSPMSHVTKDDPVIGLFYNGVAGAKKGEEHPDPTHSPMLGLMLMETLNRVGVEGHITYNGGPSPKYANATVFLIERLKQSPNQPAAATPKPEVKLPPGLKMLGDVSYIPNGDVAQKLDLYLPEKQLDRPLPLIVHIHGGGWMGGNKFPCPVIGMVGKGYAVASVEYRFSQKAKFPAQIQDCQAAIRWLRANAKQHNIDPDHVGVVGGSAGGHLSALVGTAGGKKAFPMIGGNEEQSDRVQAVCDIYGPANFSSVMQQADDDKNIRNIFQFNSPKDPYSQLIGVSLEGNPEKTDAVSPVHYVSKDNPPILILHGTHDALVPYAQSVEFAAALKAKGIEVWLQTLPGSGHGGGGFGKPAINTLTQNFFDKHLKGVDVKIELVPEADVAVDPPKPTAK